MPSGYIPGFLAARAGLTMLNNALQRRLPLVIAIGAALALVACGSDDQAAPPLLVPAPPADRGAPASVLVPAAVAFVDTAGTNQRGDARYATIATNAGVRVLAGCKEIWQPLTETVDASRGRRQPARSGQRRQQERGLHPGPHHLDEPDRHDGRDLARPRPVGHAGERPLRRPCRQQGQLPAPPDLRLSANRRRQCSGGGAERRRSAVRDALALPQRGPAPGG